MSDEIYTVDSAFMAETSPAALRKKMGQEVMILRYVFEFLLEDNLPEIFQKQKQRLNNILGNPDLMELGLHLLKYTNETFCIMVGPIPTYRNYVLNFHCRVVSKAENKYRFEICFTENIHAWIQLKGISEEIDTTPLKNPQEVSFQFIKWVVDCVEKLITEAAVSATMTSN